MANVRFKVDEEVASIREFTALGASQALAAKMALARQLEALRERLAAAAVPAGVADEPGAAEVFADIAALPAGSGGASVVVWLSEGQEATLKRLAAETGRPKEDLASVLLRREFRRQLDALAIERQSLRQREQRILSPLSQVLVDSGKREAGVHQQAFYDQLHKLAAGAAEHRVLFAEAGTGVGKTFAMLVSAAQFALSHPGEIVVLAFPTYAVLEQAHDSWRQLNTAALGGPRPADRVVLSQSAFVSQTALAAWLDAVEDSELKRLVQAWVAAGARPAPDSRSQACWQMLSLQEACGGEFPSAFESDVHVGMRFHDDDAGYDAYVKQKGARGIGVQPGAEQVIFMTHAMLATMIIGSRRMVRLMLDGAEKEDLQRVVRDWQARSPEERGLLREEVNDALAGIFEANVEEDLSLVYADFLIVDEAHLFEEWVSRTIGHDISVRSLMNDMKALRAAYPRAIGQEVIDQLVREFDTLKALGTHAADESQESNSAALGGLWRLLKGLQPPKGEAAKTREWRRIANVRRIAEVISAQLVGASSMMARLNWSPDRSWPRIQVGKTSVARELDWLWSRMCARSAVVSATLYESLPSVNAETARRTLAVRQQSAVEMSPLHPNWIFDPVTVLRARLVSRPDGSLRFVRPKMGAVSTAQEEAERKRWVQEIGNYIAEAWKVAAGGMLVLLTSYADLKLLAAHLESAGLSIPVIAQQPKRPLAAVRREFVESRRAGGKPVLLVVGAGWTGFDVTVAGDANAVTDLVMPLMPFGTNRGITQAARELRQGMRAIAYAATMVARQGLGRLVREEGTLPNRRIHFLDARWEAPKTRGLFVPIMRWISSKYSRIIDI